MLKALKGYCLVEPIEEQEKVAGLIMPDSAKDKPMKGKVLSIGGKKSPVNIGDIVFYKQWGGQDIKYQSKEYKIVKYDELLAIEK